MMLAPGWRVTSTMTAGRAVEQAQRAHVLGAVGDVGDVGQLDRRAVAPRYRQVLVLGRGVAGLLRVDLQPLHAVFHAALGARRVGGLDGGAHVLGRDAEVVELPAC